ncbi:hypothetical protein VB636_11845, partial [Paracoccus sp. APAP_BH8]
MRHKERRLGIWVNTGRVSTAKTSGPAVQPYRLRHRRMGICRTKKPLRISQSFPPSLVARYRLGS